jgi:putative FmdB family regulatory protein
MPTYEYACKGCGHEFEREQRISENPIKKCPSCGALKARRQISRTAFVLKGGGWYNDLYGTPKAEKPGGEEKAAGASSGEEKPAAKSESKPAAESKPSTDDKPSGNKGGSKGGGKGKKAAA